MKLDNDVRQLSILDIGHKEMKMCKRFYQYIFHCSGTKCIRLLYNLYTLYNDHRYFHTHPMTETDDINKWLNFIYIAIVKKKKINKTTNFQIIRWCWKVCNWYAYRHFYFGVPMTTSVSYTRLASMKMATTHMISIFICTLITWCNWLQ